MSEPTEDPGASRRFVVLGFPRSGTTLLRRLLDAHPQVSCPPETYLIASCGRFLHSVPAVDGLTIGVLSGLGFNGIPKADVLASLRSMVFQFHERIAGDKPVWVEKTGVDIFHIEDVEELLVGHARFICIVRNPLDVIVSVKDLCDGMDQILPELRDYVRNNGSLFDAYADAWIDRMTVLGGFMERNPGSCHLIRYEDLTADPAASVSALTTFMGVAAASDEIIADAFGKAIKVGLGDANTYATREVSRGRVERWRKDLPASTVARLVPRLEPLMAAYGYETPKLARVPQGEAAIRRYELAKNFAQKLGG